MAEAISPAPSARVEVARSAPSPVAYLDWPAIFGGAVVAAAVTFLLSTFGLALGLTFTSPTRGEGVSPVAVAIAIGLWFLWIAVMSSGIGGYLAGRLRRRAQDATEHESDVRDMGHGVVVWAMGTLIGAALLAAGAYGSGNLVLRGVEAAGSTASAAAGSHAAGRYATVVDRMFLGGEDATRPGGDAARRNAARVFVGLATGARPRNAGDTGTKVSDADKTYLTQSVSTRTGVDEAAARQRVDEAVRRAETLAAEARQGAERARRASIVAAFIAAVSLLIGALVAAWAANMGGRHRDRQTVFGWMSWR